MKATFARLVALSVLLMFILGCTEQSGTLTGPEPDDQVTTLWSAKADVEPPALLNSLLPGEMMPFISFPYGQSPEGIAIDAMGNMYVSVRQYGPDGDILDNLVMKVDAHHGVGPCMAISLGPSGADGFGILGLVTGRDGAIYAALDSRDPTTHGVWRISHTMELTRLPGSEDIVTPNALTFDERGTLYASDSYGGAIWRYRRNESGFESWIEHELLESVEVPGSPIVQPGANGIAYAEPATILVANTARGMLLRIPINPDGSAGALDVAAGGPTLASLDGIAVDEHGGVFGVTPASMVLGIAPVVHIDPGSGFVTPTVEAIDNFDWPTSLAFGRGMLDEYSVFVVNSDLFRDPTTGYGPGIMQLGVGMKGSIVF